MMMFILSGIAVVTHVSGFNEFTPYHMILMIIPYDKHNPSWITDKQDGFGKV